MNDKIQDALEWVKTQINKYPYSEITIKFCVHDGQLRKLERSLTEKIQSA